MKRGKILLMIRSKSLREKLKCSGELCKTCPDLSDIPLCNSERCDLLSVLKKLCNKCCNFGLPI